MRRDDPFFLERAAVAREAESWLGTPFHPGARIKGAGVDCAQLLVGVFAGVGLVTPPSIGHYPPDWFLHEASDRLERIVAEFCAPMTGPADVGDIALFRYGRAVSHAAIVAHPGSDGTAPQIVHSFARRGVVRESLARYDRRLAGLWRLRRWLVARADD